MAVDRVKRRHVFFLSGFDPKGAGYYHGLYKSHAALQGRLTGAAYEVDSRSRCAHGNSQWQVRCDGADGATVTTFEYVRWDDIVRAQWPRSAWDVFRGGVRSYAAALASGRSLAKVWQAAPKTIFSLAYPALFWLTVGALGLVLGWGVGFAANAWLLPAHPELAWVLGAGAATAWWWGALRWERRLHTTWLLRIYQFAADWAAQRIEDLPARLDLLTADILRQLADPEVDEVLLVGFSVGSMLAVSAAARVQQAAPARLSRLSLLTLGHCIPLLGLMPKAHAFRQELARLGAGTRIEWIDFSSPTDWGSFALIEPIGFCVDDPGAVRHAPVMASPRFHVMFPPEEYRRIRRDKRRMHMQYLMAGELPAAYDYFAITAGPLPLRCRAPAEVAA